MKSSVSIECEKHFLADLATLAREDLRAIV